MRALIHDFMGSATCEQSAKVFSSEETKFLKRKTAGTFIANRSRQVPSSTNKKSNDILLLLFLFFMTTVMHFIMLRQAEGRLESFCLKAMKSLKTECGIAFQREAQQDKSNL